MFSFVRRETPISNASKIGRITEFPSMMWDKGAGNWIALLLLLIISEKVAAGSDINNTIDYRSPNNVIPFSYDIKLSPNIADGNFTFCGVENITIGMINESSKITLHAHYHLLIDSSATELIADNGTIVVPKAHVREEVTDSLTLIFDNSISSGNYTLRFKFMGNISEETIGIYRSSYFDEEKEKKWIIATQFSQTSARRAFPCWDEPALKATFKLSIKHCSNYSAASNMPILDEQPADDGKMWTNFMTTPKMSTYLVAFVISDFTCIKLEDSINTNITFKICGSRKDFTDIKFIQDVHNKAVAALEEVAGEFHLPKLDIYAIPDAVSTAMEGWGLSIYGESKITVNENMTFPMKEDVAELIINNLSHQWFANVVSPTWSKYLWIKEGLAYYMQFYIEDKVFPGSDLMKMYVTRIVQTRTFWMDSSANSNTINYLNWEPRSPADIKTLLHAQMYQKGSVVMYMLSQILSREVFEEGIRLYLKKFQYGSTNSDDFWSVMQEAYNNIKKNNNLNVKDIMLPWVEQIGYPIVKVVRDYDEGNAIINQTSNIPTQASNRWCIPINYATESNPNFNSTAPKHWLKPNDANLVIDQLNKEDWIIVNLQQSGYYRVDYDETNWGKLIHYLINKDFKKIDALNRAQLINDLFYMASNDYQNYTLFFEATQYLARETDLMPWKIAGYAFKRLKEKIIDEATKENIRKYIRPLMKNVLDEIGYDDRPTDSYALKQKRAGIVPLACVFGYPDCIDAASRKFLAYLENPKSKFIDPWIFCYGGKSEKVQSILIERFENGEMEYFTYLGCSRNATYWRHYIEKKLTNSSIPGKNMRLAFVYASTDTMENWDWVFNYLLNNFDRFITHFQGDRWWASLIVSELIFSTPTADRIEKVKELVDKGRRAHLSQFVSDTIPQYMKRLEWNKLNAPIINNWLNCKMNPPCHQKHQDSQDKVEK